MNRRACLACRKSFLYQGGIAELTVDGYMEMGGLSSPGQLAILDGSPPSQGVSTAGKYRMNDGRNQLFDECYVLRVSLVKAENDLHRSVGGFALPEFKRFG